MTDWLRSQPDWFCVEQLPGYASELNPIEQAWGNLKAQELANLRSDTIDEVAVVAEGGLDRIGTDAKLCFAFLQHSGLRL
jgi:putative transposase